MAERRHIRLSRRPLYVLHRYLDTLDRGLRRVVLEGPIPKEKGAAVMRVCGSHHVFVEDSLFVALIAS